MRPNRLPYLPGLDGLRALAVLAVVLYHADVSWAPGGFLGVEVFFVISGYVITALLLAERETTGRTSIVGFWKRRARRLLPAVYALLAGLLTYSALFLTDELDRLREAAAAAFFYVTNWYLVVDQVSYFESFGRPLLLQHLWSLAVEEQFYLVWPLLFAIFGGLSRRKAVLWVLLLAGASAGLMASMAAGEVTSDRMYYGTDTRAAGFLIGCALAFAWRPFLVEPLGRWRGAVADLLGVAALGGLAACLVLVQEDAHYLYYGGFAGVSLLTAGAILAAVRPRGLVARLAGLPPLPQLGLRSYSIYLWHWPVVVLTRPGLDVELDGATLFAVRLVMTLSLAELSYRWVEQPVRDGSLLRLLGSLWRSVGLRRPALALSGFFAVVFTLTAMATLIVGTRATQPPYTTQTSVRILPAELPVSGPPSLSFGSLTGSAPPPEAGTSNGSAEPPATPVTEPDRPPAEGEAPPTEPEQEVAPPETAVQQGQQQQEPPPEQPAQPQPPPPPPLPAIDAVQLPAEKRVTAVGDSVMLGAAYTLAAYVPGIVLDAQVGRQAGEVAHILWAERLAGRLGSTVLIHVGNNGVITPAQFNEIMGTVADVPKVIFVNVSVPRSWQDPNNQVLAQGVSQWPNARLVDWHGIVSGRNDVFWDEGVHLNPRGVSLYVSLITQALAAP